jgi:hypothetical protein
MQNTQEERDKWLEMRFFFLCTDLITKTKNLQNALKFLEGLTFTNLFDYDIIKDVTHYMLTDPTATPQYIEAVWLAYKNSVPNGFIARRFKVKAQQVLYAQQKARAIAQKEKLITIPNLPRGTHTHLNGVFFSLTQIYRIGFQYGTRASNNKRYADKVQKPRSKRIDPQPL